MGDAGNAGGKIAVSIQYDLEDLGKMMPNFVDQLSVPLIAISDSRTNTEIYFKDTSIGSHFKNYWQFSDKGFHLEDVDDDLFKPMESHEGLDQLFY